jgi:hypothetical protein
LIDKLRHFIGHFLSLWSNPQHNAPEIGLNIGLLVVTAALCTLIVILFVRFFRRFAYVTESDLFRGTHVTYRRVNWFKLFLTTGMLVIALLFLFTVLIPITSSTTICAKSCHSMNPEYQSWRRSSHAKVSCVACHSSANLFGIMPLSHYLSTVAKEIRGNYNKPINSKSRYSAVSVSNSLCLRCHSPQKRLFTVTHGLKVTGKVHVEHLKASIRCTNCHNRVAHENAEKFNPLKSWIAKAYKSQLSLVGKRNPKFTYRNNMRMRQGCWRCHKNGGKFVDAKGVVKIGPYKAANGAVAPTKCSTCHSKGWDIKPPGHKRRNREGIPWKRGLNHGVVARRDFSKCQACHDKKTWCSTRCHKGITMPHASNWKQVHPAWAKSNREDCNMCHETDPKLKFCGNRCHHDSFRKQFKLAKKIPWKNGKKQHGVAAKATAGNSCFRCHDQKTWCTTKCHQGVTMPHIAGWRNIHFKVAGQIGRDVCIRCHDKDRKMRDFCLYCHHKKFGISPGDSIYALMAKAGDKVYSNNVGRASKCFEHHHRPAFCIDCHTRN